MPIKIDGLTAQRSSAATQTATGHGIGHVEATDTDFATQLHDRQSSMSEEQLGELLRQIDEQGAKLTKTPTFEELSSYRSLIKNFVSEAVSRMYELRSQAGWDRMGRQKVYTTVRSIDRKLEEMAEKIRLGQAEQLDVIASHDAIRGMLVDLYM